MRSGRQLLRSRRDLLLENLALHQQLAILKKKRPVPRLAPQDKLFWVAIRQLWPGWKRALILVQPETVVRWHPGWIQEVLEMALPASDWRG